MRAADALGDLLRTDRPVLSTREAAALWRTEEGTARRRLRSLSEAGLVLTLRPGLWALDREPDPFALAPYLTAPMPAYVSMFSALAEHGMIEQIPRQVSLVSLGRARRIETAIATFEVHHVVPELFGGYVERKGGGHLASPEKALFDLAYVRAAAGGKAYLPELSLPAGFEREALSVWVRRIESKRLRTITARRLRKLLSDSGTDW